MSYVDGFLLALPTKNVAAYRRMSLKAGRVWREHGALEYRECFGDDLSHDGIVPFPRVIRAKPGETIVFSWIVYKSRAHRDSVNAKVMQDPRMKTPLALPFDVRRMAYGGFKVVIDI